VPLEHPGQMSTGAGGDLKGKNDKCVEGRGLERGGWG